MEEHELGIFSGVTHLWVGKLGRRNIVVLPSDEIDVKVSTTGPREAINAVSFEIQPEDKGRTLVITGQPEPGIQPSVAGAHGAIAHGQGAVAVAPGAVHICGGNRGNISTGIRITTSGGAYISGSVHAKGDFAGGDKLVVGEQFSNTLPSLTILVPRKIPRVSVRGVLGEIFIGSMGGQVNCTNDGNFDATVEDAVGAVLYLNGNGSMRVKRVCGDVLLRNTGHGNLVVESGKASRLTVLNRNSGAVTFRGAAQDADIRNNGTGDVVVDKVTGTLRTDREKNGPGKIIVTSRQ